MAKRFSSFFHGAFTLVEILIVVIVLGILAAIVVPQFSDASQDSQIASLQSTLHTVRTQIDYQHHLDPNGAYPAAIDPAWFVENALPSHAGNKFGVPDVETVNSAGTLHPTSKVLKAGVGGGFWYNAANGIVRARVNDMGSAALTLTAYNLVNHSSEVALGNYGGGGGGS